jgi:hypothetical protein
MWELSVLHSDPPHLCLPPAVSQSDPCRTAGAAPILDSTFKPSPLQMEPLVKVGGFLALRAKQRIHLAMSCA